MNSIHRGRGWPRVWGNWGRDGVCGGAATLGSTRSALMDFLAKNGRDCTAHGRRNRARITDQALPVNAQPRSNPAEPQEKSLPVQGVALETAALAETGWTAAEAHAAVRWADRNRSGSDAGADLEQLREEGQVQRLAQEAHATGATGAALEADDAHDRAHVAEAPGLELGFQVHQVLAERVLAPVAVGVLVDALEHRAQRRVADVRLGPVAFRAQVLARHRVAEARQVQQELLVQAGPLQLGAQRRL